jgi:hypothetical protein
VSPCRSCCSGALFLFWIMFQHGLASALRSAVNPGRSGGKGHVHEIFESTFVDAACDLIHLS